MLTYTAPSNRPAEPTRESPWLLLLLVFVWLWPGVFSHDLWKPAEPQLFTVIEEYSKAASWLPTLFGQPYFDAPPVYVALASAMKNLLSPHWADAYSAARFATVGFTCIGLLGSGMAGFRLLGRHQGRSVVLILIGSAGLLSLGHFLSVMSVVFAGVGLCWWGASVSTRQVVFSALLTGLGLLLLAQAAGLLTAAAAWLVLLLAWLHPAWFRKRYLIYVLFSAAVAAPLLALYPLTLAAHSAEAWQQYRQFHWFGNFGGTADFQAAFSLPYYASNLLWFALPAWPLAVWTATRIKLWQHRAGALALIWLAVFGLLLSAYPHTHQDNLILILPPLALLGAAQLDSLRRGAAAFLNWFGGMTFGAAALFLWLGFFAMNYGFPAKLAERAAYFSPYYTRDIDPMPIIVALLFTPVWLAAITRKRIRGRQAVTNWAAGMTLVWALLLTLFLPWLDAAKSYRPVVQEMQKALPEPLRADLTNGRECLFVHPNAMDARIAWTQYGYLPLNTADLHCRYHLVQYNPRLSSLPAGITILWQGRRPRSRTEAFVLIQLPFPAAEKAADSR